VGRIWPLLLLVGAAVIVCIFVVVRPAIALDQTKLTVDGLPLGGKVRPEGGVYKQYDCAASTQYRELIYCKRIKTDIKDGGKHTTTTTIMHSVDGVVAYVNQFVEPATFTRADIDAEIERLSTKFGEKARLLEAAVQPGLPKAVIAAWGPVRLVKLAETDLDILRSEKSPGKGILVDYLGDFTRSARAGLPVYSLQGEFGYVWIANYDDQGRGTLRFMAVNATTLTAALVGSSPQPQSARPTNVVVATKSAAQPTGPSLEQQLEQCGEACPDKPQLDKLRLDTLAEVEKAKTVAEDAERFTAAMGNEQALNSYISSCDPSRCSFLSQATAARDALVSSRGNAAQMDTEERQYRAARGDVKALKQYVAQCNICAFAEDAVKEIKQNDTKGSDELFDLEICNNEYLPVYVAFAGMPDPNSDMWIAKGWFKFDSGECSKIATLKKGNFFISAHNKRAIWEGDKTYCTSDSAFERILLSEGGDCLEGERSKGFRSFNYEGSDAKFTWTLNPRPWTYTALAVSQFTNSWGWSGEQSTLDQARELATSECSKWALDCNVVSWARDDSCLTLAHGRDGNGGETFGWATGDDYFAARREARNACSNYGNYCVPLRESCSP
jgi:uncharacterized membrane protein